MKIFNDKNIIEIDKEDIKDAKLSSLDIADQTTRKRAFLNILGGRIAMKYLFSQKLDANNLYSLYTIHNILKNIDISDIYCNNIHADVRIVFNEEELFIPKSHEENEIYPDVYLIFKLNNSVTSATFLGYIEPKNINKNNENRDYYFVELDELKNPETIKTFLNNFSPEEKQITEEEVTQAESFFLTVTDTEISKKSLKILLHTLLYNYDLREKLVEFENFEFLSKKIATDETLGQDNLLGIVGTQELYKDEENEEKTQQEEKAEVIEEVLSDLIETKELENEAPVNNAETEDFLNELTSETEESADDDTKTSKNNTGEFLKDAGIALAGTAGVIAAGAIAANAAENVIGEIAKDTAQGATEALISGVADVAGSVTDAVVNNIKNSSEDILKDNNIELPEEILDDTLSDIDLDEIENSFSDNIEEIIETEEENIENIEDIDDIEEVENVENIEEVESIDDIEDVEEVENIDNEDTEDIEDVEEIENINDIEDIENVKDEEKPENIDDIEDIEEINNIDENTPLDIKESSIDNDIDNLDIQEFEIDENSDSENVETSDLDDFESLFEETMETDTKDEELNIQEFEIDEEVEADEISNDLEILDDVVEDFNNEEDFDNAEIEETIDEIPEEIPVKKQEQNNVETNELNNGFDNSLQPLGMIGSEDFSEGLMPLGSLEPIEDLGFGNNNNETYGYRPSAPMLDEEYENSIDNDGSNNEYRPSAPMLDTEDEEENDDLENNQETWTKEDEDVVENLTDEIEEENIIDEAILDESETESEVETESFEDLDIVEVTDDDEIIETNNTSEDIEENEEISNTEEDLDIVNVVEDSNEEDINLDDISIEEVHNEFDPESPLANTGAEPVFEGITNVEMGFNNDIPDYMKDVQGVETKQSEIVNLDEISEDVMANTDSTESAIEEDNIQTDLDSIMNTENTTSENGNWGDISDILNETENIDTSNINLDDNSLMEEITSGIDNNINTDDVNLDDINTSDALISDIDNFLSNINTPEDASNSQPATTTAYSNEEPKEAEGQEDGTLKLLFKEGRTPEIPNLFPSFTKFVDKVKSDKKMMIAASLACVVATSLIVGTIMPKNNDNVAQDNAQEMINNNQMANSNEQNDVLTEQDAQNLGMDSQYQNEGVEQQSSLAENTQMDSGQVMSSAFSNEPVNTNITKIAWEISEDLAYNDAFRKYLQMAGKNLKINIQNELLLLNELAYSDSIIINLSLDQSGNLKNTTIQKSSGSKKIDKLVLQCVKDTMKYLKVPTDEIRKSGADATLIINF